jgi:hypothetical protein
MTCETGETLPVAIRVDVDKKNGSPAPVFHYFAERTAYLLRPTM